MQDIFTSNQGGPALVIGAAGVDLVGRLTGDFHLGISNPAMIRSSFGGVARNVAENLARLGQPVRMVAAVGDDDTGDHLLDGLAVLDVDISSVLRVSGRPTGAYLAVIDLDGDLQIALDDMGPVSAITPAYLRRHTSWFREASVVFLDSNLPENTLRTAVQMARKAHRPVCADPTTVALASRLIPLLPYLDLVTPNRREAFVLADIQAGEAGSNAPFDAARALVAKGVGATVITLAEAGVYYATAESSGHVPAIHTDVVDRTGGGDALNAAIIYGLVNGMSLDEAVRLGISAASITLRTNGTVASDLTLETLYNQLVI